MAANDLTIEDISAILTTAVNQATGQNALAPVNTAGFITVAQTALKCKADTFLNALSQVLSKTVFSIRPYDRKFGGLMTDAITFGNHVRKLNISDDNDWDSPSQYPDDAESVDMYVTKKPNILQTNFYGQNAYEKFVTIYTEQLNVALTGPDQFLSFVNMIMTSQRNQIEQAHEQTARLCLANLIGGIEDENDTTRVIKLVTDYNAELGNGTPLTLDELLNADNFPNFMKYIVYRIKTTMKYLTDRTTMYHTNITGKTITRHTPLRSQHMYLNTDIMERSKTTVLTDLYHDDYLKLADFEEVNYWQNPKDRMSINLTGSRITGTGAIKAFTQNPLNNVLGVLFDWDAAGYTTILNRTDTTPFNARGLYSNIFWHFNDRYWNDFTENAVVFLLA